MRINLKTLSHAPLVWKKTLPSSFVGVRLPGGNVISASGEFGSVCIQEFRGDHFCIRYNVFEILQHFILTNKIQEKGLCAQLVLKGDLIQKHDTLNEFHIRTNQFIINSTPSPILTLAFEKNIIVTFDTYFSGKIIKDFLPAFPVLKKIIKNKEFHLSKLWADIETFDLAESILHCGYEKNLRRHFYENRIRDMLFNYLVQLGKHNPVTKEPGDKEIQAVMEAERIISADISKHLRIPDLSKKVLINEFHLKVFFKKIFGIGPYEYLVRKRMKKAKELLEEGFSIKEVAAKTGYRHSDFTTAFTQQFGFPPSTIKKRS